MFFTSFSVLHLSENVAVYSYSLSGHEMLVTWDLCNFEPVIIQIQPTFL